MLSSMIHTHRHTDTHTHTHTHTVSLFWEILLFYIVICPTIHLFFKFIFIIVLGGGTLWHLQ
jgi:hypothetical protein